MGSWQPLNLSFPDLSVGAGTRLLPMQELEQYIDDAFNKINQLKVLGKFYIYNAAEWANLNDVLNDAWSKGINNVEILLRSGVNYTLNSITIDSSKQVIIRGIGGKANLTVNGGNWRGVVILENINLTIAANINSATGTNTPTLIFRNCSITFNASLRGENGTIMLLDCNTTASGNYFIHFYQTGKLILDRVNASVYSYFSQTDVSNANGTAQLIILNSRLTKLNSTNTNSMIFWIGDLFAFNSVFDLSQTTANPSTLTGIFHIKGGVSPEKNFAYFMFCDVIGNGSDKNWGGGTFQNNGLVTYFRCRILRTNLAAVTQSISSFTGQINVIQNYFENNKAFSSFSHEYVMQLSGYYNGIVYGNSVNYTGGTKSNPLFFVRMTNPKFCFFTQNLSDGCSLLDIRDGTYAVSDTTIPVVVVADNTVRNCFNKAFWLRPTGHIFVLNNLVYNDLTTSWDNGGSYSWSDSIADYYGAGILINVSFALSSTYNRNKTQDAPLYVVVKGNNIVRRLANGIMIFNNGNSSSFCYRVVVEDNVIQDCDPERLLSSGEWSTYNTYHNKRKGVGILLDSTTSPPSAKVDVVIKNNTFINTRYGVYQYYGNYGYYEGTKYHIRILGNTYYRYYGNVASYFQPSAQTQYAILDNDNLSVSGNSNAIFRIAMTKLWDIPSSPPTVEGSYFFGRSAQYDGVGGFAGGYAFGYIPSKIDLMGHFFLSDGNLPTYTAINISSTLPPTEE
mgnify:CR=1 FL=1